MRDTILYLTFVRSFEHFSLHRLTVAVLQNEPSRNSLYIGDIHLLIQGCVQGVVAHFFLVQKFGHVRCLALCRIQSQKGGFCLENHISELTNFTLRQGITPHLLSNFEFLKGFKETLQKCRSKLNRPTFQ